ncbi:MAG: succinate--CoA ligase subunit beta [Deltaproteobacteria bacterium]|nr:succinate--CoA ligase subunit beta [Deltaproteobacteria bacterium]
MNLYEHQAKSVFANHGIPIPKGYLLSDEQEINEAHASLGDDAFGILKAQVLTGGRGKAGGIKVVDSIEHAHETFLAIKGMHIKGLQVEKILLEEKLNIQNEYFLSFTIDPDAQLPVLLISPKGGMDIEEVAKNFPDALGKYIIDPKRGLPSYAVIGLLKSLDFPRNVWSQFVAIALNLYEVFNDSEATLVEINPLVVTRDNSLIAADGRLNVDDNALFRHPEIAAFKGQFKEMVLREKGVDYVDLGDGEVGLLCAGAGMTMLTMDLIQQLGSKARCFIDMSHGINPEGFKTALEVLYSDPTVVYILLNMFGGLTRMDEVATSLLEAIDSMEQASSKPIIMRIQGTNAEEGQKILKDAKYDVYSELGDTLNCLKRMLEARQ